MYVFVWRLGTFTMLQFKLDHYEMPIVVSRHSQFVQLIQRFVVVVDATLDQWLTEPIVVVLSVVRSRRRANRRRVSIRVVDANLVDVVHQRFASVSRHAQLSGRRWRNDFQLSSIIPLFVVNDEVCSKGRELVMRHAEERSCIPSCVNRGRSVRPSIATSNDALTAAALAQSLFALVPFPQNTRLGFAPALKKKFYK